MDRIRKLRQNQGLTQQELSEKLNISQATLSNWERGIYDVDNKGLLTLANFFDVSIDYLLERDSTAGSKTCGAGRNYLVIKGRSGQQTQMELSDGEVKELNEFLAFLRYRGGK